MNVSKRLLVALSVGVLGAMGSLLAGIGARGVIAHPKAETKAGAVHHKSTGQIHRTWRLTAEGSCAVREGSREIPQLPVVFDASTGWLAFGGRLSKEKTATAFGWKYRAPHPGTYDFFCNDLKIARVNLVLPESFSQLTP